MQGKRYQLEVKTHTYERIYFIIFNHPTGEKMKKVLLSGLSTHGYKSPHYWSFLQLLLPFTLFL